MISLLVNSNGVAPVESLVCTVWNRTLRTRFRQSTGSVFIKGLTSRLVPGSVPAELQALFKQISIWGDLPEGVRRGSMSVKGTLSPNRTGFLGLEGSRPKSEMATSFVPDRVNKWGEVDIDEAGDRLLARLPILVRACPSRNSKRRLDRLDHLGHLVHGVGPMRGEA